VDTSKRTQDPTNEFLPTFYPESYSAHSAECHRIRHTKRDLHLMNLGRKFPLVGKMFSMAAAWRFRRLVPKWLETENGLFLELGCGTGWLCALAWEMGWQAVGLDINLLVKLGTYQSSALTVYRCPSSQTLFIWSFCAMSWSISRPLGKRFPRCIRF